MSRRWQGWRALVEISAGGPAVTVLHETAELKVMLVAFGASGEPAARAHHVTGPHWLDAGDQSAAALRVRR